MTDIFISYAQKDRARVKPLVDALRAEGYEVWWDLEIRAGDSFDRAIERTLPQVRCVVAVWSRESVDSDWVRAESAWAKDRNKLVSIRIDEGLELPLKFYHVNTKSMMGWAGDREAPVFQELVADARKIVGPRPSPEQGPAPTGLGPGLGSGRRGVVIGTLSLAAAALAGGLYFVATKQVPAPGGEVPAPVSGEDQDMFAAHDEPSVPEPLSRFRDTLQDGTEGPEMVVIPAGQFQMGCVSGKGCENDELHLRTVTFDTPFAIGKYEVTFAEYDRFAEATGREKPDDSGWGRDRRPVINVSWDDSVSYTKWLSRETEKRYRLPSEAEWEYATRGGTTTPFSTGECIDTDQANYSGNYGWKDCPTTRVYWGKTVEAGTLPANPMGLHEVHGNVFEWVQDCWHRSYQGAPTDGSASKEADGGYCGRRDIRGGSWVNKPDLLRSAGRGGKLADARTNIIGFRLAQDL